MKIEMRVGFTGTREGMSAVQMSKLRERLMGMPVTSFHHGDCVGADEEAANIAQELGIQTVAYPSNSRGMMYRAFHKSDIVRTPKPFMVRNHDIVLECQFLFVAPRSNEEELRSGTWATWRFAVKCGVETEILAR
jgi:hypothetical protein